MPKRQHPHHAEYADAAVIAFVVFIVFFVFSEFVILLVEQQFLKLWQSVKLIVIERVQRWPIHANRRWLPLSICEFRGRGIDSR
ncbi:MAG: hypothetical protein VW757_03120 [Halieaceae bacterium]